MSALVWQRVKKEINLWDTEGKKFQSIHDDLLAEFKEKFQSIEAQRRDIEKTFVSRNQDLTEDHDEETELDDEELEPLTFNDKLMIGITSPIWVPVGLVVGLVALPVVGIKALFKKSKKKKILKEMKEDAGDILEDMSCRFLDELIQENRLDEIIDDKMQELTKKFDPLLKSIPRLIEADRQLLMKMERDVNDHTRTVEERYRPLYAELQDLMNEMKVLHLTSIRAYDIDLTKLALADQAFAEGQLAEVRTAHWSKVKKCAPVPVIVKKQRVPVHLGNIAEIVKEEDTLR